MNNIPSAFLERMQKLLGGGYDAYLASLEEQSVRAFRVNTEKMSVERFKRFDDISVGEIPFVPGGFYLAPERVGGHPFHHAGVIYAQEPSAMAPLECIDIDPEWNVLDLCAAPGGKSSRARNLMGENAVLVSNEIVPQRCRVLTGNFERLGFKNCVTTCCDSGRLARAFGRAFELVIVDAPCSGEGMMRKEPKAAAEWSEENVKACARRQKEILSDAAALLRGGGYIIYSTCTFSLEENEMLIDAFLEENPAFELVPVNERVEKATEPGIAFDGCVSGKLNLCRRFYPHKGRGEGQFMAVLHSTEDQTPVPKRENSLAPCKNKAVFEFLDGVLEGFDADEVLMNKDTPVIFTPGFPLPKGIAFSCGVNVGELRGGYIKPHHQLFSALGGSFVRRIELTADDARLFAYLRGESIPVEGENGFAAVLCCGAPVGGGKIVDGMLKNHYPRGLRLVDGR